MNPVRIIEKKRDGETLSSAEIGFFIEGYTRGEIPDYQAAAWAMAVYFQGMTEAETTALTLAMAESGIQLDLRGIFPAGAKIVDKHSSGGVGDKTTLALGPLVAACGLPVGKMSGRGLSYTGGTIDKLESIPGWSPDVDDAQFRCQLQEVGLVVAGQTADLAPADRALYALRDVTGTVPSLPLIAASIMGKKLAAGADAIVLDVKSGRGAFMENPQTAEQLAQTMVNIGARAGRSMSALITQMEQPLGRAVGHSLEVIEAVETLQGRGPDDLQELVEALAVEMLLLAQNREGAGQEAGEHADLRAQVRAAVDSGAALEKFRRFVAAQGGDTACIDDTQRMARGAVTVEATAPQTGYVHRIDSRGVGLAVVDMGGGRRKKGDAIDHGVGVVLAAKVGDAVREGDSLCTIYAADENAAAQAQEHIPTLYTIHAEPAATLPVIYGRVTPTVEVEG